MNQQICLSDMRPGQHAVVSDLQSTGSMRRRLLDMGLIKNTVVECLGRSPGGDPSAFLIRGAVIAIRSEDCKDILIHMPPRCDSVWGCQTAPPALTPLMPA